MKSRIIAIAVMIGLACVFLVPFKTKQTSALPENLWTSRGAWQHPSSKVEILAWKRTEYGLLGAWLVIDKGVIEPAYYARLDPKYLVLYIFASIGLTAQIMVLRKICAKNYEKEEKYGAGENGH